MANLPWRRRKLLLTSTKAKILLTRLRSRSLSVHLHLPIYHYRNEVVVLSILELHDLVTIAGELAPAPS